MVQALQVTELRIQNETAKSLTYDVLYKMKCVFVAVSHV
jgi:hypothetical protein